MATESDGIVEAVEGQLRLLIMAAAQVGEQVARAREVAQRRAQAQSEQQARELKSRFAAEQRTARAELANVYRGDWWERAKPADIAHAYETAVTWSGEDPEAARAQERIVDELQTRHGINPDELRAQVAQEQRAREAELAEKLAAEQAERDDLNAAKAWAAENDPEALRAYENGCMGADRVADEHPYRDRLVAAYHEATGTAPRAQAERAVSTAETVEGNLLMAQAEREERRIGDATLDAERHPEQAERIDVEVAQREVAADRAHEDGHVAYDSAERRAATAAELEAKGLDSDLVDTRMRADVSQAKPATEAVTAGAGRVKATRARKTAHARNMQAQRAGRSR